ncbi:MAG: hypothetical protein U9N83_00765 [Thermodesulfobacteriota bacterium]|nr:hypothetical protein [Thermodesulfobacteriota bacterium]
MQSETHETLYRSLADITARIKSALGENDARAFIGLAEEHRDVMYSLKRAGLSQDAGLIDLVKETRDQVHEVVVEIDKQRDELCRQIVMFERKKRVSAAYTGNRLPVMAFI